METTHLPSRSSAASGGLFAALRRHSLIGYFGLAYGFTWTYVVLLLIRPNLPFTPAYPYKVDRPLDLSGHPHLRMRV